MTPDELKAKVDELHILIVEKLAELEEDAKWGNAEEREGLAQSLDELAVQAQAMSDMLQAEE